MSQTFPQFLMTHSTLNWQIYITEDFLFNSFKRFILNQQLILDLLKDFLLKHCYEQHLFFF